MFSSTMTWREITQEAAIKSTLIGLKFLQSTDVSATWSDIECKGATEIADALRFNPIVQKIDLGGNVIRDQGGRAIVEAAAFNSVVTEIRLNDNLIGDQGAKSIAQILKYNSTIKIIDLSDNQIGDQGAIEIANMLKINSTLSKIDLGANKFDCNGETALIEALETNSSVIKLRISWDYLKMNALLHRNQNFLEICNNDKGQLDKKLQKLTLIFMFYIPIYFLHEIFEYSVALDMEAAELHTHGEILIGVGRHLQRLRRNGLEKHFIGIIDSLSKKMQNKPC